MFSTQNCLGSSSGCAGSCARSRSFLPQATPRDHDLDVEALAREFELTGGLIKSVVVRAAFLAAREDRKLGTNLLRRAATLELELEGMGRVVRAT